MFGAGLIPMLALSLKNNGIRETLATMENNVSIVLE